MFQRSESTKRAGKSPRPTDAIIVSLARTMAGPVPSRSSSISRNSMMSRKMDRVDMGDVSLYKGISDRPLGWRPRRNATKTPELGSTSRDMNIKRWDGAARTSTEWDGLRRDPELWFPKGNCLVHLYARGQSRRGPAFRVPVEKLLEANCRPLLDRFLVRDFAENPVSDLSSSEDGGYFRQTDGGQYEMYIPAPATAERGQAFLYHTATRNFFAWLFGRSLVGTHLGGALVGLLNSMVEFRSIGEDNVQDMLDYMDEEGYADMRTQTDHALAVLYFAEHFRFKDMWIDAFAHSTGMHERLAMSAGFMFMSRTTRALSTRLRLEMGVRLEKAGRMLGAFLSDDLSDAHLGLTPGARSHLDKFRSFLQAYYVAKLGYYPPSSGAYPKNIYAQMCSEFQKLYDLMVDTQFSSTDNIPSSQNGGICVVQSTQAFDARHKFTSLQHPLPLLPEIDESATAKPSLSKRLSFSSKTDKMKPDPRLVAFSSLNKATNRHNQGLYDCSLVRAYRGFEKECIFNPSKADKNEKLSQIDARKVRWILVYAILQTLLSVTKVNDKVRDTQNVPYHLCVLTAGCPPWKDERPIETLLRTQTDQTKEDPRKFTSSTSSRPVSIAESMQATPMELKPDIDYFAIAQQKPQHMKSSSVSTISSSLSRSLSLSSKKGTVRRALSTLGNMPELIHPKPHRTSFHEILVRDYGNGTNTVRITAEHDEQLNRKNSIDSKSSSQEDISSRWSNSDGATFDSPRTSISVSRRGSDVSINATRKTIQDFLESPTSTKLARISSSVYSQNVYEDPSVPLPGPLSVKKNPEDYVRITQEVTVQWEDAKHGEANDELLDYLRA